jgi:hypothetical protein
MELFLMNACKTITLIAIFFLLPSRSFAVTHSRNKKCDSEVTCIEKYATSPSALIRSAYRRSKVLALGESNHWNFQTFSYLSELIKDVGSDLNLKYVALERHHDLKQFYSHISRNPFSDSIFSRYFQDLEHFKQGVCSSDQWAYTVAEFAKLVERINRRRPSGNKLEIIPIDGIDSRFDQDEAYYDLEVRPGDCALAEEGVYTTSAQREQDTARNFDNRVWQKLRPTDKAIVYYHSVHLISGFSGCGQFLSRDKSFWTTRRTPLSWLSIFKSMRPESESDIKSIFFDEKALIYAPSGATRLIQRHANSLSNRPFAVPLRPLRPHMSERDVDVFLADSFFESHIRAAGGQSNASLADMFDAIVWSPRAHKETIYLDSDEYLPHHCPIDEERKELKRRAREWAARTP